MDDEVGEHLARAKAGDKDAYGKIYNLFLEKIYRFIYYLISDADTAYDITQDTFIRAWKALPRFDRKAMPRFDRNRGSFSTFLYTIARNLVIDNQRKRVAFTLDLDLVGEVKYEENFEESIDAEERSKKVRKVLKSLPKFDRELVVLRYFEDMSFAEISKIVGKEEGAVRVRVFRILKGLKEKFGENI